MIIEKNSHVEIPFYKFDGAGNDFVVVDNREGLYNIGEKEIAHICHRRFGIGADGLMMLSLLDGYDFQMDYYNSDGRLGSMCGNGGRCIVAFAHILGLGTNLHFKGYDGPHDAEVLDWNDADRKGMVRLNMSDVEKGSVRRIGSGWFLDTGSPHFVLQVEDLQNYDVVEEGRAWRNRQDLFPEGTNVDFVEPMPDGRLAVRTYERGVEDETWACGTGVTACALVTNHNKLCTKGGDFNVLFSDNGEVFSSIQLIGPVSYNFSGVWTSSAQ